MGGGDDQNNAQPTRNEMKWVLCVGSNVLSPAPKRNHFPWLGRSCLIQGAMQDSAKDYSQIKESPPVPWHECRLQQSVSQIKNVMTLQEKIASIQCNTSRKISVLFIRTASLKGGKFYGCWSPPPHSLAFPLHSTFSILPQKHLHITPYPPTSTGLSISNAFRLQGVLLQCTFTVAPTEKGEPTFSARLPTS